MSDSGALAVTFVVIDEVESVAEVAVVVEGCGWEGSCFGFVSGFDSDSGWRSARSFLGCFGGKENEHGLEHERGREPVLASGPGVASAFASGLEPGFEVGWDSLAFDSAQEHRS